MRGYPAIRRRVGRPCKEMTRAAAKEAGGIDDELETGGSTDARRCRKASRLLEICEPFQAEPLECGLGLDWSKGTSDARGMALMP